MRFPITFNAPSKIILGILGAGPLRSYVDVTEKTVVAKMGWVGSLKINRADIANVEHGVDVPWWLGMGMHAIPGTVALNGALGNAVKITMRPGSQVHGKMLFVPIRPHTAYVSVENPEALAYELGFGPR